MDVLDRPDLARRLGGDLALAGDGGILRPGRVIKYTLLLENATTAAKVGFFLEQHKEALMVEVSHLESLRAYRPRKPHYLMRGQRGGRLVSEWNLVVPLEVLDRSWQEVV